MADIDRVLDMSWDLLRSGVESRKHPMHLGVVATVADGKPEARTVVLRRADRDERRVCFHTDRRAPKVSELSEQPAVSLVFYHPEERVQLRLRATAALHHGDEIAREAWRNSLLMSRACYLVKSAPSAELAGDLPQTGESPPAPTEEQVEPGFANFAVVECVVEEIDWLHLQAGEHARAVCRFEDGRWVGTRVQA